MKLSEVKTDKDWEEYLYRREMQSYEVLRIESGIGPGAHSLPARHEEEDYFDEWDTSNMHLVEDGV